MHALWTYWQQAWPAAEASESAFAELCQRYREPHRHYHTLQHLQECFGHFELLRAHCQDARAVLLALWYHDAIYDTHASDNEARSADLADAALAGEPESLRASVRRLIMVTCHQAEPDFPDAVLLVDIDLGILGAAPVRFAEYECQVRGEYAWVDAAGWRQGRAAVLRGFLQRPRIYGSGVFAERYEVQARLNLATSLAQLNG